MAASATDTFGIAALRRRRYRRLSYRSDSTASGRCLTVATMSAGLSDDFPRRALIEDLARRHARHPAVEQVWLFGSPARGDNFERSNIDLAVGAPGIDRANGRSCISISRKRRRGCS
jgi:hypothetical protein